MIKSCSRSEKLKNGFAEIHKKSRLSEKKNWYSDGPVNIHGVALTGKSPQYQKQQIIVKVRDEFK